MGLFEQLQAYIDANTPRSTRPVAKPSTVINQGLLNPNKFNAPAANRFKDSAFGLLGIVPGVGDAASAAESADLFNRGEKFAGSVAALGALPLVPALGGMFIGKGAKTWDAIKASEAEQLLKQGIDPREVWKQTGTLKGVDGALRQEIPDNLAKYDHEALADLKAWDGFNYKSDTQPLAGVIEHKNLFSAYPDAEDIPVHFMPKQNMKEAFGSYSNKHDRITLADIGGDQTSPALHEIQHAIQQREGWSTGSSPKELAKRYQSAQDEYDLMFQTMKANPERADEIRPILDSLRNEYRDLANPNEAYRRLAGEAEARLTQSRMGLDAAQRLQHYPYDQGPYGLDVPLDSLIVRGLLGQ